MWVFLFPFYDHIEIIVQWQIAQIVNKIVYRSLLRGVEVGEVVKIKTAVQQFGSGGFCLPVL